MNERLHLNAELEIARLGQRGEGLARFEGVNLAVPYAEMPEVERYMLTRLAEFDEATVARVLFERQSNTAMSTP